MYISASLFRETMTQLPDTNTHYSITYLVDNLAVYEGQASAVVWVGERHGIHPGGVDRDPAGDYVERSVSDGSDHRIGRHRAICNRYIVREPQLIRESLTS